MFQHGQGTGRRAAVNLPALATQLIYLDQALAARHVRCAEEGRAFTRADLHAATMDGAVERVRPKMMTVTAIAVSLTPILWNEGTGPEVIQRIAVPMIGGMASSTFLTLLVIPAIYALVKGWRLNVTVTSRILSMSKEALRHDEAQIVFRACHGDVEQPPLLLYLGGSSGAKIGWHAAVDNIEDEHRFPFLTLGGMYRGEDQVILIEKRHARLITRSIRRIERQLDEEALALRRKRAGRYPRVGK